MTRECKQCKVEKKLSVLNFLEGYNKQIHYFTNLCRKCYNKNEAQKRKERRNIIIPSKEMQYVRQEVIGYKTEPYFIGENYEYIAPTYKQILREYGIN